MAGPTTISPQRLRVGVDRPPFRTLHTYPLQTTEYVDSTDPLPTDWLHDFIATSPPSSMVMVDGNGGGGHHPSQPGLARVSLTAPVAVGVEDAPSESIENVDWTLDGHTFPSLALLRRPLTPLPLRRRVHLPTSGATTTSSSDSSIDTPLSERRKKNHQAFLARTRQFQSTPTPHNPASEARMLAPTPSGKGQQDSRSYLGDRAQDLVEREEKGEAKLGHSDEFEHEVEEEVEEVEETPIRSSSCKATGSSEYGQTDDDVYSPRRSARNKRKIDRKQSRAKPYTTTTRSRRDRAKAVSISAPLSSPLPTSLRSTRPRTVQLAPPSSPIQDDDDEDISTNAKGLDRVKGKVKEFREYLVRPKRLREPRFDMKVFHWAMSDCPELQWQSNGRGVVIHDIDRFYKNVLHKEIKERKEQRGQKVSKRDLPGKSSFERQLSGYGFTRATEGRTMYITRPDLRRDDRKLLKEIKQVWDAMANAVRLPKAKAGPALNLTFYRKLNEELEVLLNDKEHEVVTYQRVLAALLTGQQPDKHDLSSVSDKLGLSQPESAHAPYEQKSPLSMRNSLIVGRPPPTPLKSIDEVDVNTRPAKRTRRSTKVKKERLSH